MYPNSAQPPNQHPTELSDLFDAARKVYTPTKIQVQHDDISAELIVAPNERGGIELYSVKELVDEYRLEPERRKGTIVVDDLDSFIFLVNRDKNAASVIFARVDQTRPRLVAVLDFHHEGVGPRFCEDRVRYDFPLSDEWKTWTSNNGKEHAKSQIEFARFIEDNIFDIGEPGAAGAITQAFATKLDLTLATPQRLMQVSRRFELNVKETVANVVNLESGEVQLVYTTEHKDKQGGPVNIPGAFHLRIPIFKGGALYSIPVRLRHRNVGGGNVAWFYELHREDLFLLDAINEAIAMVRKPVVPAVVQPTGPDAPAPVALPEKGGCGLPVVIGSPPKTKTGDE